MHVGVLGSEQPSPLRAQGQMLIYFFVDPHNIWIARFLLCPSFTLFAFASVPSPSSHSYIDSLYAIRRRNHPLPFISQEPTSVHNQIFSLLDTTV